VEVPGIEPGSFGMTVMASPGAACYGFLGLGSGAGTLPQAQPL